MQVGALSFGLRSVRRPQAYYDGFTEVLHPLFFDAVIIEEFKRDIIRIRMLIASPFSMTASMEI